MRINGLSITAIACMIASPALAQNTLEFVHEPTGQAFTPPHLEFVGPPCCSAPDIGPVLVRATASCAAAVEHIYSYRRRIYLACLRKQTDPLGITVIEMDNPDQVAALYGTKAN